MGKIKIKSLRLIILLMLLITCMPSRGLAEEGTLEAKIQKLKNLFEIGEEYVDFYKYEHDDYGGKKITYLNWTSSNSQISVSLDEEGNIISYSKNEYRRQGQPRIYRFPKITVEEGEERARAFIEKVYPDIVDKVDLADEGEAYATNLIEDLSRYNYSFRMIEKGIVFKENTIYISVDSQNGEVISFNIVWEEGLELPDTEDIISKDEAKEIYRDNINLELAYRERDKDKKAYLGYSIIDTDKTVDAKTKDIIGTSYKSVYYIYGPSTVNMESLSDEEAKQLIASKKVISKEEASKRILEAFELGEEYKIGEHKLKVHREKDIYVWEVMVTKHEGDMSTSVSGIIDAKSGEIIDFIDPGTWEREEDEPKYSKEELLKRAKDIIKELSPVRYKEVEFVEDDRKASSYGRDNVTDFLFKRKVNGIRVEKDGIMIALDNTTGKVLLYYYYWSDLDFESPDSIIEEDEAKEILLKDRDLVLEYQSVRADEGKREVKLVYDFKDKYLIVDAKTREVIDSRKELMERDAIKEYMDIEESYAKDEIRKLQRYITLFEGDELKPKEAITQQEFFRLLGQTVDIYLSEDVNYLYERFIRDGILKEEEKDMEGELTREEAIKYVVRAFGQDPLEGLGDIYKLDYEDADDISPNLRGHVAIAKGLGLIRGEGRFRPKDNLTREEAVVIIYNILNRK